MIPSGSDTDGYSDSDISDMEVDPPTRPPRAGMSSSELVPVVHLPTYMLPYQKDYSLPIISVHFQLASFLPTPKHKPEKKQRS